MKSGTFKIIRFFALFLIIVGVGINLSYLAIFIYNHRVFNVERVISGLKFVTLRNFSIYLIYLSTLSYLIFGYALNTASPNVVTFSLYVAGVLGVFGIFALINMKYYTVPTTVLLFKNSGYSIEGLTRSLFELYNTSDFFELKDLFVENYVYLLKLFQYFQIANLGLLAIISLISMSIFCIDIDLPEDDKKSKPCIVETTIDMEVESLRQKVSFPVTIVKSV